jgi:homocysteine S-methyltransferase
MNPIATILCGHPIVILDGALATELERRGCDLNDPLWSARVLIETPELIRQVHADYFAAGADCAITASYQATYEGFARRGIDHAGAAELLRRSVMLAVEARDAFWSDPANRTGRPRPFVAASIGPYGAMLHDGSEYRGDYTLSEAELVAFHRERMAVLIAAGADMLACETIPCLREARALLRLIAEFPTISAWFSFTARDEQRLSSGEPWLEAVALLSGHPQVAAIGINCTAPRYVSALVRAAATYTTTPIIAYPNSGEHYDAANGVWYGTTDCAAFGDAARAWYAAGARVIGGCCRTTPEHIAAIAHIDADPHAAAPDAHAHAAYAPFVVRTQRAASLRPAPPHALAPATLAFGETITAALLGIDTLYRHESGDTEGLIVVDLASDHRAESFANYNAAHTRFAELARAAADLPEPDRRVYYAQLCASTMAVCRWRQGRLSFTEQLNAFLHVPAAPASVAELDELRAAMRTLLTRMGYSGDLASQAAAWESCRRVPADEVQGVLTELLSAAWDRTNDILPIPAPKSDGMRVATVRGVPYNARCDYTTRTIELNIDPVYTYEGLRHLAVHEGYPGHYVQFKLREAGYLAGAAPADGLLSVVNTASSSPFEGIADNGLHVIGWDTTDDDRLSALITRYRAGIGTTAAWQLHALNWPAEQVRDWLHANALVGGEGWVANRMGFITAPQRSVLIWSYWWGEACVRPVWQRVPAERRADFLHYLYGRMHSPQTVGMFVSARAQNP